MTGLIVSLSGSVVTAIAAILAAFVSRKAERNTRPVSNGFASGIVTQLGDIQRTLGSVEQKIDDHIADHATHKV